MEEKKGSKYKAQIKYNKKLVRFPLDFKPEVINAFKEKCKENGTTPTTEIKRFVNEYIETH